MLNHTLGTTRDLIHLLRPKQWVKNIFVLAPLLFSGEFVDLYSVVDAVWAVIFFCLAASAVYIINDYYDIESDQRHPIKSRTRPLASGAVSRLQAVGLLAFIVVGLVIGYFIVSKVMVIIAIYILLNCVYTLGLKNIAVIDIFCISVGFVLRVYAGAVALSVPVSPWMFVTTLCLALFLGSVKRRQELRHHGKEGRQVLDSYSLTLVDKYAMISSMGALFFYSLFVITEKTEMVVSVPVVIYGLFRYWYLAEFMNDGESPADTLLSDWQLILTVLGWLAVCIVCLWPSGWNFQW